MQIFIYCKVTLHVSGVTAPIIRSTKKLYPQPPVQVIILVQLLPSNVARWDHVGAKYLYRRLRLQFLVPLMMGPVTPVTCRVTLQ